MQCFSLKFACFVSNSKRRSSLGFIIVTCFTFNHFSHTKARLEAPYPDQTEALLTIHLPDQVTHQSHHHVCSKTQGTNFYQRSRCQAAEVGSPEGGEEGAGGGLAAGACEAAEERQEGNEIQQKACTVYIRHSED